jgi:hypothetical protein
MRPRRTVSAFKIAIWVWALAICTFLVAVHAYGIQLRQVRLLLHAPVVRVGILLDAMVTFWLSLDSGAAAQHGPHDLMSDLCPRDRTKNFERVIYRDGDGVAARWRGVAGLSGSHHLPSPEGSTRHQGSRCASIALRATAPWHRALGLRPTVNGETHGRRHREASE